MNPSWLQRFRPAALLLSILMLLSLLPGPATAQLSVNVIYANVNTLSISDVDFLNATAPKWLFTVAVTSVTPGVNATMSLRVDFTLADGGQFPNAFTLVTNPFPVPLTFTNIDLTNKQTVSVQSSHFDDAAKQRLKDLSLPTGSLPAGTYHFYVTVNQVSSTNSGKQDFVIILSNPSSMDLVFPADGDPSVSPLPLFQWRYDGPASRISIFEKRPQYRTLEDAATGIPQLTADVAGTQYQYPGAGVRPLEPGKTYVWYVEGLSAVTGGTVLAIKSELRSFTVSSNGAASLFTYLDELERALDPKYKPVFDQIRAENLIPTGIIRLNGAPISTIDLLNIIQQFRINPDAVQGISLDQSACPGECHETVNYHALSLAAGRLDISRSGG